LSFAFPWRCCGELANIISVVWIPTCPCSCLLQNTACSAHTIQAHGVVSWMAFL
jgi:hypothetical protein